MHCVPPRKKLQFNIEKVPRRPGRIRHLTILLRDDGFKRNDIYIKTPN
jgi:hypothetical protein